MREIGAVLHRLRASGQAPDVVVFQEAFSRAAAHGVIDSGYPSIVSGPTRTQSGTLQSGLALPGRPKPTKGEIGIRFMSSGLMIATRYPIVASASEPYSRMSCAGFDCLANKGVLFARIVLPGVPDPIDILNTHMNAQRASRVAPERHLASHNAQSLELAQFLLGRWDRANPVIFGGDFNMRRAPARFGLFSALHPLDLVHQYCLDSAHSCDVRMSWDGDAPWMDTQDLQLFASGARMSIAPIRVEAMFDGSPDSPKLSDHDGFRVVYRLSWNATSNDNRAGSQPGCFAEREPLGHR